MALSRRQLDFLDAFPRTGTISGATAETGVVRQTHYNWLNRYPEYAEAFGVARERFVESLEAEAVRRAREGVDEPLMYQGVQVGAVRKFSDVLTIFLLKANRPDKYRDEIRVITESEIDAEIRRLTAEVGALDPGVETGAPG